MNFVYNGINYNYDIFGNDKFNLLYAPNSSFINTNSISLGYIPIIIYNTQSIPTPSPFQQDIAICNGSINIGNNFAYVNNATLFNQVNPNGQNVYFTTTNNSSPNIYSWYEGQLINGSIYCDVWWINLPNGIPANSNITIYMYVGNSSTNYYSLYYPYVGTNAQVIGTMQYDNGNYTFIAYGYFNNTFDGWTGHFFFGYNINGSYSPTATPYGIEMLNGNYNYSEDTYILPPNNGNIPLIPLIVEEAWSDSEGGDSNIIALFGDTSQQISDTSAGSYGYGYTYTSNLSTFAQFDYAIGELNLVSAITNSLLNYALLYPYIITYYSYLIVNSTYAEAGYYYYSPNQVWVPLTLLDTYTYYVYTNANPAAAYTYSNLSYNPFQYGTLEISAGDGEYASYQYVEWVVARSYPPNGVMPSIYIG
jgi:hypothetical protein